MDCLVTSVTVALLCFYSTVIFHAMPWEEAIQAGRASQAIKATWTSHATGQPGQRGQASQASHAGNCMTLSGLVMYALSLAGVSVLLSLVPDCMTGRKSTK